MPQSEAASDMVLPTDPTVESLPSATSGWTSSSASTSKAAGRGAALVHGAGVELTAETHDLLQRRLRTASILLFLGFAAFLVRHYFRTDFSQPVEVFLFVFHALATVVLGAVAATLFRRGGLPLWWLRVSEGAAFGLPAVVFLATQYFLTLASCHKGVLDFPEGLWLVLIYTYALFIPNTRPRAAVVLGLMCLLPMALLLGMMWRYTEVAACVGLPTSWPALPSCSVWPASAECSEWT